MITWRSGVVTGLGRAWSGALEVTVEVDGELVPSLAYPDLVGRPVIGDRVLLNTTALTRGLGTGGYAFVVALPDRLPPDPPPGAGHIVKSRYSPLQTMVLSADEQDSPFHDRLADADDIAGLPVVVADLHSALPAVIAGARWAAARTGAATPKVTYVMNDGAALPLWFSRAVAGLREAGWVDATVSAGQAFGGEHETVTVHSALVLAEHVLESDLVVLAQGPGNVGTGSRWGFSGVAAGEALNAVRTLRGTPVAAVRMSGADRRSRHYGISHHTRTTLERIAIAPVHVPVPQMSALADLAGLDARVQEQARELVRAGHRVHSVAIEGLMEALASSPVPLSTMGRDLRADPGSFLAGAVAGVTAFSFVRGHQRG